MADKTPTSYGPSEELRTHTPIQFGPLEEGMSGDYATPAPLTLLKALSSLRSIPAVTQKGLIRINPNAPDYNPSTIRHEAVHAALLQSPIADKIAQLAANTPGFGLLSTALKGRAGNMEDEVPAYAAENDPQLALPEGVRNTYVGSLIQQLQKLDPNTAKIYSRLAQ